MNIVINSMSARPSTNRGHFMHGDRCSAFTMLELVIVLIIISIVSTIGIIRYAGALSNYRLESACRRLCGDLDLAREEARAQGESMWVVFDAPSTTYYLTQTSQLASLSSLSATSLNDGFQVNLSEEPYRITGMRIFNANDKSGVRFNAFGEPDNNLFVYVRNTSREMAVTIDVSTGRARIQ